MKAKNIKKIAKKYQSMTSAPLGFAFCDLESGESCTLNGDRMFPMASVFKIFVLTELFRMAERGELSLEERVTLREEDKAEGSGLLQNVRPGCALTIYDYAYLMMAYSDNTATDIIMRRVTPEMIRQDILEPCGLREMKIDFDCTTLIDRTYSIAAPNGETFSNGRATYRNAPYFRCETAENDMCTPGELMRGLQMLYAGGLAGKDSTEALLDVMKKCALNQRIPMYLPKNIPVAHKTGSLDRVANDAGIVYTDKGAYVLVLFYNGNCADLEEYLDNVKCRTGNDLLARLSREVYEAYVAEEQED